MINNVDIIITLILLYVSFIGWQKGIVRLCIGFFSFIAASFIAGIYFTQTHNIAHTIFAFFIGSFILSLLLSKGLASWNKKVSGGKPPFILSRLLGVALITTWMGSLAGLTLFAVSILPVKASFFQNAKNAVLNSKSYALIEQYVFKEVPAIERISLLASISEGESDEAFPISQKQIEEIRSSKEFKAIHESETMQKMLQDEDLMKKIQNKDITGIISDPKMQELLQDKQFIADLQSLYGGLLQQGISQDSTQEFPSKF
ncbi:MAG: CvpA family protein [Candidatus Aceula meridiana]|nr:CvpA family protein [Candidatus Aceula meridiana]